MNDATTEIAAPAAEVIAPPPEPEPWQALPEGVYAIVELFGHAKLVGRIAEVDRFGTKMLQVEPIFRGKLLDPVLSGGGAIYRLTQCSRKAAWERQHQDEWSLPAAVQAIAPVALLEAPKPVRPASEEDDGEHDDDDLGF